MTFEEYLENKHANQYEGLDDEMPDDFNLWLEELDTCEWQKYANDWKQEELPTEKEIFEIIKNSHFIATDEDCYNSRKEKEDWLEKDCFGSLAKALAKRIGKWQRG